MATGTNSTSFSANLKKIYKRPYVETMVFTDKPFLAMLPKNDNPEMTGGSEIVQPVFYADPQSRSADISTAITASTSKSPEGVQFGLTTVDDFGIGAISGKFIRQSKSNAGAFWTRTTQIIDSHMRPTSQSCAISLYRAGWGDRGQVGTAATTMPLKNKQDVSNFAKGMDIVFSSSQDGAVLRDSGTSALITGVNRNTGTLTIDALPTGTLADDYIFVKGDRENSATPTKRMISGLESWLPATAPTGGDSHFGVDRSSESMLYGISVDATDALIDDALIETATQLGINGCPGGDDIVVFMHPEQNEVLTQLMRHKERYNPVQISVTGEGRLPIMFTGVVLQTSLGRIKIVPDRFCPIDRAYMLKLPTWKLYSLGGVPDILNHGNVDAQWLAADDGIQIRVGYYAQLGCSAPGWNANIQLPVPT